MHQPGIHPGQMLGRHLCYHYTIGAPNWWHLTKTSLYTISHPHHIPPPNLTHPQQLPTQQQLTMPKLRLTLFNTYTTQSLTIYIILWDRYGLLQWWAIPCAFVPGYLSDLILLLWPIHFFNSNHIIEMDHPQCSCGTMHIIWVYIEF